MHCYKINGLKITAKNKLDADQIDEILQNICPRDGRALIFIPENGVPYAIMLPQETAKIFSQNGDTIVYVGQLLGGVGQQILSAAIDNFDDSSKFATKLKSQRKMRAKLAKEPEYTKVIDEFESKLSVHCKGLFLSIVDRICNNNDAYKVDMYEQISANVVIRSKNWLYILNWFATNVLESKANLYQKRKAFITTVIRMGAIENRTSNSIQSTRKEYDSEFWDKYLDQGQSRS